MPTTRPRAVPLPLPAAAPQPRGTVRARVPVCTSAAGARASAPPATATGASASAATPAPEAPAPAAVPAPAAAERPAPLPTARPSDIPRLATSASDLLDLARHGLAEAALASTPHDRYAAAHLSALRAAAAVIAARAKPSAIPPTRRSKPLSAWVLLATVAPELGEWAAFFASGARKRAAAEAHLPGAVNAREADDLLRDAETFLAVVETKLGGAARPSLLDRGVG